MTQHRNDLNFDSPKWSLAKAVAEIRSKEGLTQEKFCKKLGISRSYLAALEGGHRQPSVSLVRNLLHTFKIRKAWFDQGVGEMKSEEEPNFIKKYFPTRESRAVLTAIFLTPALPAAAAGLAVAAGASEIVQRMCRYHGAKDPSELANKFGVKRSTISHWISNNCVPQKYIDLTSEKYQVPELFIKSRFEVREDHFDLLVELIEKVLKRDRSEQIDREELPDIVAEAANSIVVKYRKNMSPAPK